MGTITIALLGTDSEAQAQEGKMIPSGSHSQEVPHLSLESRSPQGQGNHYCPYILSAYYTLDIILSPLRVHLI